MVNKWPRLVHYDSYADYWFFSNIGSIYTLPGAVRIVTITFLCPLVFFGTPYLITDLINEKKKGF